MPIEEIEAWKQDVCALLSIPEAERTEQEQIRLWARRVRLLYRGWRVVLSEKGEPVFLYVGHAREEDWTEIRKDEFEYGANKKSACHAAVIVPGRDSGMAATVLADQSGIQAQS